MTTAAFSFKLSKKEIDSKICIFALVFDIMLGVEYIQ